MYMTSKRTINVEKDKQGFQKTVKAEPVTEANLEQAQENQGSTRYRFISDIAQDFLPKGSSTTTVTLNAILDEMSRKRYGMEEAALQIEQVLAARDIAERFPNVASVEFQVGSEREFSFVENTLAFDADGNEIDEFEQDYRVRDILSDRLSTSSREVLGVDYFDGSDQYAKLDIAELNKKWR